MSVLAGCDLTSLQAASKCFNCLSATEKLHLKVHFMAQALKAFGGTDYTATAPAGLLRKTVSCLECTSDFVIDSMEVAVWQKLASLSGAPVSQVDQPINVLRGLIKCATCGEQDIVRASKLFLLCNLTLLSR